MFNIVFFHCILTLGNSNFNSHKLILRSQHFMLCFILIILVVNIYNIYWNFSLLKRLFILTVWKTTLYVVIFEPLVIPTLTVANSILRSQHFTLCFIFNIFVVNIYNKYWNFPLLKRLFILTIWKTTLYVVIFEFTRFPLSITTVLVSQSEP